MLVLACSPKPGGRCIAGLSLDDDRLIRPVAPTATRALQLGDCAIDGDRWPRLLEIVTFEIEGEDDLPWQPENLVVAPGDWQSDGQMDAAEASERVASHLHEGGELFGNHGKAVPHGVATRGMESSLELVIVSDPTFIHDVSHGHHRARVSFCHGGGDWTLTATDPVLKARLLERPVASYAWRDLGMGDSDELLLTLSLADVDNDWHTKLVAAVIPL